MKKQKPEKNGRIPNAFSDDLQKQIAEAAYHKWIKRGQPSDSTERDWLEAEQEVMDSLKTKRK